MPRINAFGPSTAMTPVMQLLLFGLLLAMAVAPLASMAGAAPALLEEGRRIYEDGILVSGAPLQGERFGGTRVEGAQAACMNCHRRSGMGSVEGDIQISPITGNYLFTDYDTNLATMDPRVGKRFNLKHKPYTGQSLARTLSTGINNAGTTMNAMMPKFRLGKQDMSALTAYLKQLSVNVSPGITDDTIQLATVIAPGVEPERRKAMLDIIQAALNQKNASTVIGSQRGGRRHMVSAAEMVLGTERRWQLNVWELQGEPATWAEQLRGFYAKQPVFALVSGLSNGTWAPVHEFCDRQRVPCWFPNTDLPESSASFYSLYFTRGVMLEAEVLAKHLQEMADRKPSRIVQIIGGGMVERGAAAAFMKAAAQGGLAVEDRPLTAINGLGQALQGLKRGEAAMLWLRRADLGSLATLSPPPEVKLFVSAELAGDDGAGLPPQWKPAVRLIYPYELPEKRQLYVRTFHSWLNMRKLPLVDEPLQAQTFFAMTFLTDTVSEMLDNLHRDYLIERAENMLSRSEAIKRDQKTREVASLGQEGELARRFPKARPLSETVNLPPGMVSPRTALGAGAGPAAGSRQSASFYPRMGLGVGQHFASKGAYIVRFEEDGKVVPDSEWITP